MKSIRAKLWGGMMILVVVIIVLLWLFQIVFLNKFYMVLEIGGVRKNAESIVTEIEKLSAELARACGKSAFKKYREELDAINRECRVLEKEKTTVSGLRRLYVLKERCRALKWKIALEESLN